jgi:tetratricopeptide (TPR) repeat protein
MCLQVLLFCGLQALLLQTGPPEQSSAESIKAHKLKAQLLRRQGKYRKSVDEWRAALKLSPADHNLKDELATTLFLSEDFKANLPELNDFLRAEPNSAKLNFFVGDSLFETQRIEEAVPYLKTAVKLDPKLIPAHVALGLCYLRLGDAKQAIRHLKIGLTIDKDGSLYYQLARAYQQTGQPELAQAMMDKYQQLQKPGPPTARVP